jgi:hypothetical protein
LIVHDLVERTLRGTPRFVARRGRGHSRPEGGRRASEEPDEIGLNSRARERHVADFAVLRLWRDRRSCTTRNGRNFGGRNIGWLISESPLVDGNHVIVTPGGTGAGMVALDKMSGQTVWVAKELSDEAGYASAIVADVQGVAN